MRQVERTDRAQAHTTIVSQFPWIPERPLSAEDAAEIIRRQFPEVACKRIEPLGEGWDFFMFRVNRELAFRFPKKAIVDRCVERELALLDRLPRDTPLAFPRPLYRGKPDEHFPWRFWGYRLIEGEPLSRVEVPASKRHAIGERVAEFLSMLHAMKIDDLPPSPWVDDEDEMPFEAQVRTALEASREAYPPALFQRCLDYLAATDLVPPPFTGEHKQVHCDLLAEHILIDPQRCVAIGIIDWGDCNVGDPAGDFVGLWMWGGDGVLEAAIASYSGKLDSGARRRIRHLGTLIAMEDVHYGVNVQRVQPVKAGLATLTRELLK